VNEAKEADRIAMPGTITLCLYKDADVVPKKVTDNVMAQSNTKRQAELIIGFLCRSIPNRVVREFCELTGADYDTILKIGAAVQTKQHRKQSKHQKLNPDQVRDIRTSELSNLEEAELNGVSERTIRDVRQRKSYLWVSDTERKPRDT